MLEVENINIKEEPVSYVFTNEYVVVILRVFFRMYVCYCASAVLTRKTTLCQKLPPPQCCGPKDQGALTAVKKIVALGSTSTDHSVLIQTYMYLYID